MKPIAMFLHLIPLSLFLLSSGCKKGESNPVTAPPDSIPQIPGWTLVWSDEFNGTRIDPAKWAYEIGGSGWGNKELEYYTARPSNSFIENGCLVIQALKESYLGSSYTSARMNTTNIGDWKYGRFDIKAQLPYGKGIWPAIWLLPTDWVYGGWPASGEIDIMELLGHDPWKVYGTIHYGSSVQNHQSSGGSYTLPTQASFAAGFHLFTIEWDSVGIRWFVDGVKYHTEVHGQPFDQRFHLLLNVAVGGEWPGYPDDSTIFPQRMVVDYVRVYRKNS